MPIPLLVYGAGALGIMGANSAQKDADRNAEADAKAYGIKVAGIDFSAERQAEFIANSVDLVYKSAAQNELLINKAHAEAESDAKVAAAVAGVSGQSVDMVINDTERTAKAAKASLKEQVDAQKLQIESDYTDNFLNAHMSKGTVNFKTASKSERFMSGALGFAKGFIGAL